MRLNELQHVCNDIHSQLNSTTVRGRLVPTTLDQAASFVHQVHARGEFMSVCGSCHAMGGQQFAANGSAGHARLNRALDLDERGLMRVEAGITWPDVIRDYLVARATPDPRGASARSRPAPIDSRSAAPSREHSRPLPHRSPFIDDIESLDVVTGDGEVVTCSRTEHPELFRHVIGGYGLFGVVVAATLRLVPRQQVERVVRLLDIEQLIDTFEGRIAEGYLYGDFQFATDPTITAFCAPECSRAIADGYAATDSAGAAPALAGRLEPPAGAGASGQGQAFEEFCAFLSRDFGTALLERHAPAQPVPGELSRRARSAPGHECLR